MVSSALRSESDLSGVGGSLRHVYPLESDHGFDDLLALIDHADRAGRSGDAIADPIPFDSPDA